VKFHRARTAVSDISLTLWAFGCNVLYTVATWIEHAHTWAAALLARYRSEYVGRHRRDSTRAPFVEWAVARERATASWIREHAQPVTEPSITEEILMVDESDIPVYNHKAGSGAYQVLRPRVMAAQAQMDRRALQLRSPWMTPEEVDEWESVPA